MIGLLTVAVFATWLLPYLSLADEPARDYSGLTTPLLLAVRTGDDDDIDDLIVERGKKTVTERKPATNTGSGVTETEDDLYVGNKPHTDNATAPAQPTTSTPSTMKLPNCGTAWSRWVENLEHAPNPCPAGCEKGDQQLVKTSQEAGKPVYSARYQCHKSINTSSDLSPTTGLGNTLIRTKPLSSNAVGTLSPESGKWHSFVTVKGPNFAKAERVVVLWYPNDDSSKAASGSITATLRKRVGTDEIEIEMPRDAGGPSGGVVRVYLFMPNQLQPLLAGRFVLDNSIRTLTAEKSTATLDPLKNNTGPVGPELTSVTAISMFAIKAEWKPVANATSYVVKALESGKSQPASSPEYRANAVSGGISGLTPGFPHDVWVEARYPDKRVGASHIWQTATLNPVNPTDLSATLTGPGSVRLSWTPIPGAVHYIVEGSQLPKPLQTKDAVMNIDNVPMGRHEWRVMAAYGPGVYNDRTPAVVALILQSAGSTVTGASASEPNAVGKAVGRAAKSSGKVAHDAAQATGKAVQDATKATGKAIHGAVEAVGEAVQGAVKKP